MSFTLVFVCCICIISYPLVDRCVLAPDYHDHSVGSCRAYSFRIRPLVVCWEDYRLYIYIYKTLLLMLPSRHVLLKHNCVVGFFFFTLVFPCRICHYKTLAQKCCSTPLTCPFLHKGRACQTTHFD